MIAKSFKFHNPIESLFLGDSLFFMSNFAGKATSFTLLKCKVCVVTVVVPFVEERSKIWIEITESQSIFEGCAKI